MRVKMPRLLRRFTRKRDGAMLVEFGFLFPLVLAALMGVISLGLYLFSVQRTENVMNQVADSIMRMENPTLAQVRGVLDTRLATASLPSSVGVATITTRDDGMRVAKISIEIAMLESTPILNTKGFKHEAVLSVPLLDR